MTQEQLDKTEVVARRFEKSFPDAKNNPEAGGGYHGVRHGIFKVLDNPTDFGLVTLETMFEFTLWIADTKKHGFAKQLYEAMLRYKVKSVPELFKIFTTQNKEK